MKVLSYALKLIPFLSVITVVIIGCDLRIGIYPLLPALFLIPVYYWLMFCPRWLSLPHLFIIGLFYDALIGSDFGLSSFLLMVSAIAAHFGRSLISSQQFLLLWGNFCLFSFCYLSLYGMFSSNWAPLFFSWVYSIFLYPVFTWVLSHLPLRSQRYG